MLLTILLVFSLVLLPSIADAAFCTDNWEVNQAAIGVGLMNDFDACVAAGSNQGCFNNALDNFDTASTVNDIAWVACCITFGPFFC